MEVAHVEGVATRLALAIAADVGDDGGVHAVGDGEERRVLDQGRVVVNPAEGEVATLELGDGCERLLSVAEHGELRTGDTLRGREQGSARPRDERQPIGMARVQDEIFEVSLGAQLANVRALHASDAADDSLGVGLEGWREDDLIEFDWEHVERDVDLVGFVRPIPPQHVGLLAVLAAEDEDAVGNPSLAMNGRGADDPRANKRRHFWGIGTTTSIQRRVGNGGGGGGIRSERDELNSFIADEAHCGLGVRFEKGNFLIRRVCEGVHDDGDDGCLLEEDVAQLFVRGGFGNVTGQLDG